MTVPNNLLSEILGHAPSPDTILIILSKLKQEGRFDEVIDECTRTLNLYPRNIPVRQLLVEAYLEKELISKAEEELEKIASQINDLVSAYKLQAVLYHKERKSAQALEALNIYLAHHPDDTEALDLLRAIKPEATPREETPAFEEALPSTKGDLPREFTVRQEGQVSGTGKGVSFPEIATPTLAEIYFNQGDTQEAISTYERVLAQNPGDQISRARLEKLKLMLHSEPSTREKSNAKSRAKKEKMISILEVWRSKIELTPGDPGSS